MVPLFLAFLKMRVKRIIGALHGMLLGWSQITVCNFLDDNARSRPSTIANRRTAILPILKLVQQGDQNATSRAAKSVTERNRATSWIHVLVAQAQYLLRE